jgi:hypothetical protein
MVTGPVGSRFSPYRAAASGPNRLGELTQGKPWTELCFHGPSGPAVWTFPRTDFGPGPKVLPRNLVHAAEVHAGKPQLAANEEQPSLPKSADLSKASAVECILSRRDRLIVARHEVPGPEGP